MTRKTPDGPKLDPNAQARKERLAAELRANLRRRKAQGRAQDAAQDEGDVAEEA